MLLTRNSEWQVDGVNYFQSKIRKEFLDNTNNFVEILEKQKTKHLKDFWNFYFEGFASKKMKIENINTVLPKLPAKTKSIVILEDMITKIN